MHITNYTCLHMYADLEEDSLEQSGQANLLKTYQCVNKELHKHKLYLDQLLTIVIDSNPEILSLVAEAQKRRCAQYLLMAYLFTYMHIITCTQCVYMHLNL